MKIKFKSTITEEDQSKIIEVDSDLEIEKENGVTALIFDEKRNEKIIRNRIEYNDKLLKIFSGISTLECNLNEVVKNDYVVEGISSVFYLYTKLFNIDISKEDYLLFEYYISNEDKFNTKSHIKLELTILK